MSQEGWQVPATPHQPGDQRQEASKDTESQGTGPQNDHRELAILGMAGGGWWGGREETTWNSP